MVISRRILQKLVNSLKTVPIAPSLLILGLIGVEIIYVKQAEPASIPDYAGFGEAVSEDNALNLEGSAFVNNTSPLGKLDIAGSDEDFAGFIFLDRSSLGNSASPVSNVESLRNGLLSYRVKEGDSVSTIAAEFGISVNTILWANNIQDSSLIRPGQEIIILPVSGVLHEVKEGETLDSIAALYGVPLDKVTTFNNSAVKVGDTVVVPSAKPAGSTTVAGSKSNLPDAGDYFILPVESGWNWGRIHDGNAVDISNACGTPIVASADGIVISVGSPLKWNGGYGGFVRIEHPNGTKTFYGHTSSNFVSIGEAVSQGDVIARIGRTGRVSGTTGCHVHFNVSGAQNPFAN